MNKNKLINVSLLLALLLSGCSAPTTNTTFDNNVPSTVVSENKPDTNIPALPKPKQEQKQSQPKKTVAKPKKQKRKVQVTKKQEARYRIGAVCNDGTTSNATGRGACSWHGGVDYWIYNR